MLALSCVDTLLACAANLLPASRADSAKFFRLKALLNAITSHGAARAQGERPERRGRKGCRRALLSDVRDASLMRQDVTQLAGCGCTTSSSNIKNACEMPALRCRATMALNRQITYEDPAHMLLGTVCSFV